ncbi:MAG TPA: FMN-binding negative transcriptional regulator [Sphingomicrobium sp.]|nr:FMN-binding negative transcriptional regulator [Sphingomicrobium sp.]
MHPNAAFEWKDEAAMLRFVGERRFAHIFTASGSEPFVVHAPVLVTASGAVQFHVARRNRIAERLDGQKVMISVAGRDSYQSANWYVSPNQVPTWHYEAVEIEGAARRLPDDELVGLLDRLSDEMEDRHSPEKPWTRGKMEPGTFEAMTKAIVGFEVAPSAIRGTRKFNQHKKGADLAATIEGQRAAGRDDIVAAIEELVPRDQ